MLLKKFPIVVLGAGSIGVAFAATLSEAGAPVTIVDPDAERRMSIHTILAQQRAAIAKAGLGRSDPASVEIASNADDHFSTAALVIECGPEDLAIKQSIFKDILQKVGPDAVVATASSAITISRIVADGHDQARCLVAHPVNPPSVLRVIELVPAQGTTDQTMEAAKQVFQAAGFATVALGHEIEGFVLNRLQGAVLREAYRLVEEGVTNVAGIDDIMRLGLGPRWALSGPFETAELNTPGGIRAHADRMGPAYKRMGEARGETVDWNDNLVTQVVDERRALLRDDQIAERVAWRAQAVASLVATRDTLLRETNDD
ncbi:3-hydroxyacyl-CoA dehydrogenase NAD-binding domain-containing protein [Yoonia algicola]|uniref:3-hydroxyacyl-CoA dehydrogenase NAD-binding domain-containing protein n=1 Tax=Yoonia algicola TaxID=3137368 RepID=A0AAN0M0Q1_9RHOB